MVPVKNLVVEDERIIAVDIKNSLINSGYTVPAIASSGEEAIEKAAEFQPDLVLMDIMLKGKMDGIEAATEIRTRFNIPVVYLTSYSDQHTIQRAKVTEPFGYILKPFEERELFTTIVSNAIKYFPHGRIVRFDLVYQPEKVVFQIQDQGIGIPEADRADLFNAFHRGTNVGNISGTGLGLSIVKQCLELHNGAIAVSSVVEVGTTFTVTLPVSNYYEDRQLSIVAITD